MTLRLLRSQMVAFDRHLKEIEDHLKPATTERFAVSMDWGTFQGTNAVALNAAFRLGTNVQANGGLAYGAQMAAERLGAPRLGGWGPGKWWSLWRWRLPGPLSGGPIKLGLQSHLDGFGPKRHEAAAPGSRCRLGRSGLLYAGAIIPSGDVETGISCDRGNRLRL